MRLVDIDYIEAYTDKWENQKKAITEKYQTRYPNQKVKVTRTKSDTKGLRSYKVEVED